MSAMKFDSSSITDQKRLVRGQHLLMARSALRARDEVHNRRWRILMLAGGAPDGEVSAIRELMPKAHITAVDKDDRCIEAAIEAGVDDVICCDLADWGEQISGHSRTMQLPAAFQDVEPFDILHLDLCGAVNETSRHIFKTYRKILNSDGVIIFTFSYGRDVVEMFASELSEWRYLSKMEDYGTSDVYGRRRRVLGALDGANVPEAITARLCYLLAPSELERVRSIMIYRGSEMPMCSFLFRGGRPSDSISFVRTEPGDFDLAVAYPDPSRLYDYPQSQIEALRRSHAAIKASLTRGNGRLSDDEWMAIYELRQGRARLVPIDDAK